MSTPFNVRSMAAQAGIQTTGGFAVIAECVTLEELERFAHIAIANAAKNWQQTNDQVASELQGTCHKQAQQIAALEQAARRALEAFPTLDEFFNRYVESIGGPYFGEAARIALLAVRELPRIEGALREALEALTN